MRISADRSLPDRLRTACAWVATRARSVAIDPDAFAAYTDRLDPLPSNPEAELLVGDRERRAAFVICLDAINFGSGWWPTIRKRPGLSGYATMAAGLEERFRDDGAWAAAELCELTPVSVAAVFGQEASHPLMAHYATALRDVGTHVTEEHGGSFERLVDSAAGSAPALAGLLAGWQAFADVSIYMDRPVPFFKRAQIAAADLDRMGVATLGEQERLTAFADNLVPHVLRVDGVLRLDPGLEARIEAGELLTHGSPEEVELRACAVHAIELLSAASPLSPAQLDSLLWSRGAAPRYKSLPRPRSRNTAY